MANNNQSMQDMKDFLKDKGLTEQSFAQQVNALNTLAVLELVEKQGDTAGPAAKILQTLCPKENIVNIIETGNSTDYNDQIIAPPNLGDQQLSYKAQKELIALTGRAVYAGVDQPHANKIDLDSILSLAKRIIDEEKLTSEAAYELIKPAFTGMSLTFINNQQRSKCNFLQTWVT